MSDEGIFIDRHFTDAVGVVDVAVDLVVHAVIVVADLPDAFVTVFDLAAAAFIVVVDLAIAFVIIVDLLLAVMLKEMRRGRISKELGSEDVGNGGCLIYQGGKLNQRVLPLDYGPRCRNRPSIHFTYIACSCTYFSSGLYLRSVHVSQNLHEKTGSDRFRPVSGRFYFFRVR